MVASMVVTQVLAGLSGEPRAGRGGHLPSPRLVSSSVTVRETGNRVPLQACHRGTRCQPGGPRSHVPRQEGAGRARVRGVGSLESLLAHPRPAPVAFPCHRSRRRGGGLRARVAAGFPLRARAGDWLCHCLEVPTGAITMGSLWTA